MATFVLAVISLVLIGLNGRARKDRLGFDLSAHYTGGGIDGEAMGFHWAMWIAGACFVLFFDQVMLGTMLLSISVVVGLASFLNYVDDQIYDKKLRQEREQLQ